MANFKRPQFPNNSLPRNVTSKRHIQRKDHRRGKRPGLGPFAICLGISLVWLWTFSKTQELDESLLNIKEKRDNGSDLGVPQEIYEEYATKMASLFAMVRENLDDTVLSGLCQNKHQHCAYWTVTGFCDSRPRFMNVHCAPLCQTCDEVDDRYQIPLDVEQLKFDQTRPSAISTDGSARAVDHVDAQIEWIRSKGGIFSSKLEIKRFFVDDPDSPSGLFTKEGVSRGETLMVIPKACLLTSGGSEETCDTVRNLADEFKLKEESKFWPYVNWVFDPRFKGDLPVTWSGKGKQLLETIVGEELFPHVSLTGIPEYCWSSPPEPLEFEAYLAVLRRSWDDIVIPVFDMVNHRNGHWANIDSNSAHEGKDITVYAKRDIAAGEQLYLSYNECEDCDYAFTYVLHHILRDYGFVEQYPRRWNFFNNKIIVQLEDTSVTTDSSADASDLKLTWVSDRPMQSSMRKLSKNLERLKNMRDDFYFQVKKLDSSHERSVTLEFFDALVMALEQTIQYHDRLMVGSTSGDDY